ncbi:MAG TPA: amino acid adenylation domain-containing protein [Chthoniobacterales bacterium]|nr:amino acid adenylation domain-containing protein [Chthoniobacterales bacterium]
MSTEGIAIIGAAGRFPGAQNLTEFWNNLCAGVESITRFSDEELLATGIDPANLRNPSYVKARAKLNGVEFFDSEFFGLTSREAELMDPQHRFFLETAWHALEDAGYNPERFDGAVGVYAGLSLNTYLLTNLCSDQTVRLALTQNHQTGELPTLLGNDKDFLTTRVAYKLNLRGPAMTVQCACSTSLVAIAQACQSLLNYQCDMALAGGVSISFPQHRGYFYEQGGITSDDGHCRPFDRKAQGTVFGDGVGIVVLKRLDEALADRDSIYAVIKGYALNNDGSAKVGYFAPSVSGQAEVIATAQAMAGFEPASIGYVETHGTATPLGDPIEIEGLTQAFRAGTDANNFCAIGSVKSNVGHLESASGVTGLIKTTLALKHGVIPPTLHFEEPNPRIDFANSPFYVASELIDWKGNGAPRRAGVSSFGVGGTNAHLVLEEAPEPEPIPKCEREMHLFVLSARTHRALATLTDRLIQHFVEQPDLDPADVAFTLQVGRRAFEHRRMVFVRDLNDAVEVLRRRDIARVFTRTSTPKAPMPITGNEDFGVLAPRWFEGEDVDWVAYYTARGEKLRRIPLPGYPFERKKHWVEPIGSVRSEAAAIPANVIAFAPAVQARIVSSVETRRDRILARLRTVFQDLSGEDVTKADASATFFDLGFDSLLLTQAGQALHKEFGIKITFRQLIKDLDSLGAVARHLDEAMPPEEQPAVVVTPIDETEAKALPESAHSTISAELERLTEEIKSLTQRLELLSARNGNSQLAAQQQKCLQVSLAAFKEGVSAIRKGGLLAAQPPAAVSEPLLSSCPDELEGAIESLPPEPTETIESALTEQPIAPLVRHGFGSDIPYLTSFSQQRLWFIDQLRPHSWDYNLPIAMRILGPLDHKALEQSFSFLVRRHEVLRTTFRAVDGEPMQFIAPAQPVTLSIDDLRDLEPAERTAQARDIVEDEAWTPFDLSNGPLFRVKLLRTEDTEHVLVINFHHIVFDDWSEQVLMHELVAAYKAFVEGGEPKLAELPIQYADFAQWQRESLQGTLGQQLEYWRRQLADLPQLQLPTDHPRPRLQSSKGANEMIELPLESVEALKGVGKKEGATFFMTVLAAFKVLLARYTKQDDIVVGSPIANRSRPETEPLIGFFLNTLVLRTKLDGDPTFREVVQRVREMALEAYQHQELPFESLVEALAPKRDLGQNPLFQILFVLVKAPPDIRRMHDLTLLPIDIEDRSAKFDVTMLLLDGSDGIRGYLNYNADLFDSATMRRFAGHFRTLLEAIAENPDARISQLPLLTAAERERFLVDWNQSGREFSRDASLIELFEKQVALTPENVAVVSGGETLTYGELNCRANGLARFLQARGVREGGFVGLCVSRSVEQVVAILAILKTGSAYVPLDPAYPAERLAFMLEDSGARLLLTQSSLADSLPAHCAEIVCLDQIGQTLVSTEETPSEGPTAESPAYVIYTSGSTGKPKGVLMPHRPLVNLIEWQQEILPGAARTIQFAPVSFDVSFQEIFSTWCGGGTLLLIDEGLRRDPVRLWRFIVEERVERLFLPFVALQSLAEAVTGQCALRDVITAGEQLRSTPQIRRMFKILETCRLHNHYGPSETHVVTAFTLEGDPDDWAALPSIGRPIANTAILLLDDNGQPDATGELYIGGECLCRGYLNRAELTAEKFVSIDGNRFYKSGDLARWLPDGNLEFLGRADGQVKVRGFRVELGEVEAVLSQHPSVRDVAVTVKPDTAGLNRLVAYAVCDGAFSASALREYAKSKLPDYFVPSLFLPIDKLPLTPSGKVNRRALPDPVGVPTETVSVAPRDQVEHKLVAIWQRALNVPSIGITDDFFELGGHSLMAVRVFADIEKTFGKQLPLATLFEASTIEQFASTLREEDWKPSWSSLVTIQPQGSRPPFFGVHGGYGPVLFYRPLAQILGLDQPFYGFQSQGLDGSPFKHTSVQAIASYYLEEMRSVQANGPYFLGGYCLGGLIAFEMAQQLHAQGEEVSLLVLFDTYNPARPPRRYTLAERLGLRLQDASRLKPGEQIQYFARRASGKFGANLKKWQGDFQKMLYKTRGSDVDAGMVTDQFRQLHVRLALERARDAYKPLPYAGRITLFRATIPFDGYDCATDLGWTELADGGMEIHNITGNHESIFKEPNIRLTADKLRTCIEAAQVESVCS